MDGWKWPAFLNRLSFCALSLLLLVLGSACGVLPRSGTQVANERPNVIPSLREWSGGWGDFTLAADSRISLDPAYASELSAGAQAFREDLRIVTGQDLSIVHTASPAAGDVLLTLNTSDPVIGPEGYLFEADSVLTIRATTAIGVFFGTRTALQIIKQDEAKAKIPRGNARDYPKWKVRGFMLDVGRMYFSMNTLRDYVKFMSYYKMNEFHVHLNDNAIKPTDFNDPSGFRMKSDAIPGLENGDESYTKAEWSSLEALAEAYGVTILAEFDSPAHSLAFTQRRPDLRHPDMAVDHLDLGNPATTAFMDSVFTEFLPVFAGPEVHIGTDEYNGGDRTDFMNYVNHLNALLKAQGKKARMWGSQGSQGGADGFDRDIVVDIWYNGYYDPVQAVADGYEIVNVRDAYLYIVPTAGYYHDYLPTESLYDTWEPHVFGGGSDLSPTEPKLLGGKFAVWNDMMGVGYDAYDVYDRVRPAAQTLSEKLWSGTTDVPYATFKLQWPSIGNAPGTNLEAMRPRPR